MRNSRGAATLRLQATISIIHGGNNPEAGAAAVWVGARGWWLAEDWGSVGVSLHNEADNERETQLLKGIKPG